MRPGSRPSRPGWGCPSRRRTCADATPLGGRTPGSRSVRGARRAVLRGRTARLAAVARPGRERLRAADLGAQRRAAQAGRPGALPAGRPGYAAARRARQPSRHWRARSCSNRSSASSTGTVVIISHDRYLLDETVSVIVELEPAHGDGAAEALGGQLLGLRDAEGAGAAQAAAGLHRAAERDRAPGGGDRALQAVGAASRINSATRSRCATSSARSTAWTRSSGRCWSGARWRWSSGRTPRRRQGDRAARAKSRLRRRDHSDRRGPTIMNGERVGIVGPNGAGKSVLLRTILAA